MLLTTVLGIAQESRLALFIDCNCDKNYLRQEISYVDHVRDQALADVQLFVYDIKIGSGGRSYTLDFKGKNDFDQINKQLVYETTPNMTHVEIRKGLTKKIGIGLLGYLLESKMADNIIFSVDKSDAVTVQDSFPIDVWGNWIFEIYGEGEFEKESSRSNFKFEFGYEGDKVTEKWKIRTDIEFNNSGKKFENDGEEFNSHREKYEFDGSIVRSLSNHWSIGIFSGIEHDTYNNQDLSIEIQPAIEYNIFPYSEVLMREITFAYRIGYIYNDYQKITIFGESSESLYNQTLNLETKFRQPWGAISAQLSASSYLHDFSKNHIEFDCRIHVRVYKGLAVRFSSNLELIHNQLTLPAGDASLEDLLLKQRRIATDFEIGFAIGLSYTFGSAFNNIVNTRL